MNGLHECRFTDMQDQQPRSPSVEPGVALQSLPKAELARLRWEQRGVTLTTSQLRTVRQHLGPIRPERQSRRAA